MLVKDPDLGINIGGWVGRLTEVKDGFITLAWDSITLSNMPAETISQCEEDGLDWSLMGLEISDIELTESRDFIADVEETLSRLQYSHEWDYLGEQGARIQSVMQKVDSDDEWEAFEAWQEYLQTKLKLPFEAEIYDGDGYSVLRLGEKVKVLDFTSIDDMYGILVTVSHKKNSYQFPLCNLEVINQSSPNYQPVKDYAVWFANR